MVVRKKSLSKNKKEEISSSSLPYLSQTWSHPKQPLNPFFSQPHSLDAANKISFVPNRLLAYEAIYRQLFSYRVICRLPVQFDRRITHLEWLCQAHPSESFGNGARMDSQWNDSRGDYFIGVATKSGDLLLYHPEFEETGSFYGEENLPVDRRSTTFITSTPSRQREELAFRRNRPSSSHSNVHSSPLPTATTSSLPTFPMIRGYGAGHAISQFKFGPFSNAFPNSSSIFSFNGDPVLIYSTTISGFLQVHDLLGYSPDAFGRICRGNNFNSLDDRRLQPKILLRTDDAHYHWFTSLCIHSALNILVAGSTKGEIYWTDLRQSHGCNSYSNSSHSRNQGHGFSWLSLHKSKIQDLAFDPVNPYLLLSSSNDRRVCLWDWRYMKVRDTYHASNADFSIHNSTDDGTFIENNVVDNDENDGRAYPEHPMMNSQTRPTKGRHSCYESEYYMPMRPSSISWRGLGAVPLAIMPHSAVVTSVEWDPLIPGRFLTTAQNSECRIYDLYDNSTQITSGSTDPAYVRPTICIQHPHRQFQHLTTIRASWHPSLPDTFVIGRYPDPHLPDELTVTFEKGDDHQAKEELMSSARTIHEKDQPKNFHFDLKSIDIYSSLTGQLLCQWYDPVAPGIHSIVKFHPNGDILASASGTQLYFWSKDAVPNKYLIHANIDHSDRPTSKGSDDSDDDDSNTIYRRPFHYPDLSYGTNKEKTVSSRRRSSHYQRDHLKKNVNKEKRAGMTE